MTIGALIRKIRMDKGMTQKETAQGILSRSHLSELEHNNYYPTYDKMITLVYRLGLSLEEFERELHQNKRFFEDYYSQHANDLSTESKIDELAAFLETEFTEDVAKHSLRLEHKRLNMLGLIDFIRHNGQIDYAQYQSLFTYLLKCQNWRHYELALLSNSIFLAEYPVAKVLAKQFVSKFQNNQSHFSDYKIPVFFNNLAEMALLNHEFKTALEYCQVSQGYTVKNHDLYNQLISETLEHMANNLLGKESGTKLEERLQLFINLNYQDTANYYSKLCKQLGIEVGVNMS
ncbi:helix-turn-helix domain-containing protein [Sporolactobacillus sp. STCC-11]|uniref:helix-turn-helix domain-containing protein n=1 Tax=Sporolactobacillus caesalpiniae TaxID=3230362 RepID=UPI00339690C6